MFQPINAPTKIQKRVSNIFSPYFTEQELDDAAIIARHLQHHEQHLTYAEIFQILLEMRR